jgi:hypothetical protein
LNGTIRYCAYELREQRARADGHELDDWIQAGSECSAREEKSRLPDSLSYLAEEAGRYFAQSFVLRQETESRCNQSRPGSAPVIRNSADGVAG